MSSTRHKAEDSAFRQERYMSSPELQRGLRATCVAARVRVLDNPEHRKLIWWLQKTSMVHGDLKTVADEIIKRWPERVVTRTMQKIGVGRRYSAEEVKRVRRDIFGDIYEGEQFLTKGEIPNGIASFCWSEDRYEEERKEAAHRPSSYPSSLFEKVCLEAAQNWLAKLLFEELCLNPAVELNEQTLWYLPSMAETLSELYQLHVERAHGSCPVVTKIGEKVNDCLSFAMQEPGLVIIDGVARIGKTFAAEAFCDAHPGQTRYVQVPSANDDISFFRALCQGLGISCGAAFKANELRQSVESVLQTRDVLLVLDEGHNLFSQRNLRKAVPHRINWVLNQLVNKGVPVAILTTPQFTKCQEQIVANGGWSSEQLIGRITHYEKLPTTLAEADLAAVARHWLPAGDDDSTEMLVAYAQSSEKYLQGISSLVKRARFLAHKEGKQIPSARHIAAALKESVVPSDTAIVSALECAHNKRGRRSTKEPQYDLTTSARAENASRNAFAMPLQGRSNKRPAATNLESDADPGSARKLSGRNPDADPVTPRLAAVQMATQ